MARSCLSASSAQHHLDFECRATIPPAILIGNGLYALLEWPNQKMRLCANPRLIRTAVEGVFALRKLQPAWQPRHGAGDRGGRVTMPAGTLHHHRYWRRQSRPDEFFEPDWLDLAREPNRHLAFGSGAHVCAGPDVARLEGRIAIGRFLARFPHYRLAGDPIRGGRARFRGFLSIPVQPA